MKHKPKHPHLDAVLAFLRQVGAVVKRIAVQRHIIVRFVVGHRTHELNMPASPRHPHACAKHICQGLQRKLRCVPA